MPRIGIGLGLGLYGGSIDAQAQAHYDRVIADGGVVPAGVSGVNAFFNAVKSIYGTSDITSAVSVGVDAHYLGYKLGAGAGATSGQAVQKLYSCAGSSGDVVQTTAASQPLLLAHNGADNYYYGSGVSGNYVSTPNASANQITGDIEIIAKINYINNATFQWIVTKISTGTTISYSFAIDNSNSLRADFGATNVISTVSIGASYNGFVKMTRSTSSGDVKFYTSSDGITYTQLGTTRTTTSGNLTTGSGVVNLGTITGTALNYQGKIYRATIANSIGGTPVVDFNPATYNASTSQTQWTSTTGEVWTINTGTAATGYKGVLVDRTIVQGDGVDDRLTSGTLTLNQPLSTYSAVKGYDLITKTFWDGFTTTNQMTLIDRKFSAGLGFQSYAGASAYITTNIINLNLITWVINGSSSSFGANNNLSAVSSGTRTNDSLQLFGGSNGFGNNLINTIIQAKTNDNTATKTAMYNYIRSINNNAF